MKIDMRLATGLLVFALWCAILTVGFGRLLVYANTPGRPAIAVENWPADSRIERGTGKPTLLVFLHPRCPCSDATLGELEELMPKVRDRVLVHVVFFKPESRRDDWAKSGLWKKSMDIPGVLAQLDVEGEEAARFGALTSGQVLLYDTGGRLTFRGGITPARGHRGENAGRDAVLALMGESRVKNTTTPVYGCSLKNPERAPAEVADVTR